MEETMEETMQKTKVEREKKEPSVDYKGQEIGIEDRRSLDGEGGRG